MIRLNPYIAETPDETAQAASSANQHSPAQMQDQQRAASPSEDNLAVTPEKVSYSTAHVMGLRLRRSDPELHEQFLPNQIIALEAEIDTLNDNLGIMRSQSEALIEKFENEITQSSDKEKQLSVVLAQAEQKLSTLTVAKQKIDASVKTRREIGKKKWEEQKLLVASKESELQKLRNTVSSLNNSKQQELRRVREATAFVAELAKENEKLARLITTEKGKTREALDEVKKTSKQLIKEKEEKTAVIAEGKALLTRLGKDAATRVKKADDTMTQLGKQVMSSLQNDAVKQSELARAGVQAWGAMMQSPNMSLDNWYAPPAQQGQASGAGTGRVDLLNTMASVTEAAALELDSVIRTFPMSPELTRRLGKIKYMLENPIEADLSASESASQATPTAQDKSLAEAMRITDIVRDIVPVSGRTGYRQAREDIGKHLQLTEKQEHAAVIIRFGI